MSLPEPDSITSSTQLFTSNYTLPQIRQVHRSINGKIDDLSSRLRTQVGAGYRELLDTAERIVHMQSDNDRAINLLSDVTSQCSHSIVAAKSANLARLQASQRAEADTTLGRAARLRLLEACVAAAARWLCAERPATLLLLLAAKVLVVGRLLARSFFAGAGAPPPPLRADGEDVDVAVQAASRRLEKQRTKLLGAIERLLGHADEKSSRDDTLNVLCAYALIASNGAKDVLQHFLHVRGQSMALFFDTAGRDRDRCTAEDVKRCLELYARTIVDVQKLVPMRLEYSLRALAESIVVNDAEVRKFEGLRLDMLYEWCSEEICYFSPYIRHDDLKGAQAREILAQWIKGGCNDILNGLSPTLEHMSDFSAVIAIRHLIIQTWFKESCKIRGIDSFDLLNSLRNVINEHLLFLVSRKIKNLHLVASEIEATLSSWKEGVSDQRDDIWDIKSLNMEQLLSSENGAMLFLQELESRRMGRNAVVSKAYTSFKSWSQLMSEVGVSIVKLRQVHWESDFDDEVEDEDVIKKRVQLLNNDDPTLLEKRFDRDVSVAFSELDTTIKSLWLDNHASTPTAGAKSYFLLRVLRDIRALLPSVASVSAITVASANIPTSSTSLPGRATATADHSCQCKPLRKHQSFGLDLVAPLHDVLVSTALTPPLQELMTKGLPQTTVPARCMWQGSPVAVPVCPSAWLGGFLRGLVCTMDKAGVDLWSLRSLKLIKARADREVTAAWKKELGKIQAEIERIRVESRSAAADKTTEKDARSESPTTKVIENDTAAAAATRTMAVASQDQHNNTQAVQTSHAPSTIPDPSPVPPKTSPNAATPSPVLPLRDLLIQWAFDIHYLRQPLLANCNLPTPPNDELGSLFEEVLETIATTDDLIPAASFEIAEAPLTAAGQKHEADGEHNTARHTTKGADVAGGEELQDRKGEQRAPTAAEVRDGVVKAADDSWKRSRLLFALVEGPREMW